MKKPECKHKFKYKETVVVRRFSYDQPMDDDVVCILVCEKCGEVKKV